MTAVLVVPVLLVGVAVVLGASIRVLRECERGVVFRFGRLLAQRGPGLIFLIAVVDRMVRVGLRTVTLKIPAHEVITRDNRSARVRPERELEREIAPVLAALAREAPQPPTLREAQPLDERPPATMGGG